METKYNKSKGEIMKKIIINILISITLLFSCSNAEQADIQPITQKADISFLIADIKFNDKGLKILEFGQCTRSKFKGYDALYGAGKIWSQFWHYLSQFNKPIWYVGDYIFKDQDRYNQVAYQEFEEMGGHYAHNIRLIEKDPKFIELSKQPFEKPDHIDSYNGIIVCAHTSPSSSVLKKFKRKYPQFLVLDDVAGPHVNNKYLTSLFFDEDDLKQFRPQCKAYKKEYNKSLASQIINEFLCKYYVIKPLSAAKGYGVIITTHKRLDYMLKNIINRSNKVQFSHDPTFRHWLFDRNKKFIVEEFETSKTITVEGRRYDPTMRMVFALHYDQGKIHLTFIDGYWKLPVKSLDEKGTLTQKRKSNINPKRASSAKIAPNDLEQVKTTLSYALPKIYYKMLQKIKTRHISIDHTDDAPITLLRNLQN